MKFFRKLREMLAARHARPLVVTATADGAAAVPVADVEEPLMMAWGPQERPMKPSEVTVRFAPKALIEILAAPRCLLVMTDPGGWRLFPLDERALATPLVEFAWQAMGGVALDDDDRDALGTLRRTVAPYVAVDDKADASEPGSERRADYLAKLSAGKGVKIDDMAPVRSNATVADAVEPFPDAPFAVFYFVGCGEVPERPRLTLSVRDTYGATNATVVDAVVDSHKDWLPCDVEELLTAAMKIAASATSKGVRGGVGDDFNEALTAWLRDPTAVIHLSVNGATPQLVAPSDPVVVDPRKGAPDGGPTLDVEVLVPTLPAADARAPAQKFWLEPEVPCLVAACVVALEAGEPHPSKPWKRLYILGENLGVGRAKHEVRALMLLIALGRFPRPNAVNATSPFRRSPSVAILADMDDLGRLYDASSGLRQFLDDHCRDLGARARKDALLLVVAKRLSRLTRGSGSSGPVIDHALGDANRTSGHPHAVAASLLFAYWVAEGGARGFSFRGSPHTYSGNLASETSRSRFVGAVLRAGLHAYGDYYDAAGADRAKRSLTDLAVLWTAKFDPDARVCYEAAGAAGNALAADVAARLGAESPATLKKLLRKYPLDAFATKHLETLPAGLARLEAVFRHDPPDEDDGAPRAKKDKRRAAVSSADAAAVGDSFALEDPGASGTLSKKKQAERDRKARDKEKEEKRRAKRKKADARRREQAEREAAALQWRPRAPTRPLDSDDDAATV